MQNTSAEKVSRQVAEIAFQGAPGSYSHVAALLFIKEKGLDFGLFPDNDLSRKPTIGFSPCKTIESVFEQVSSGKCKFGVIAIANSTSGSTQKAYELILAHQVSFLADMYIPIHHQLIGLPGTRPDTVRKIVSHPIVLKQCRNFLAKLPEAKPQAYWDTSSAAFFVRKKNDKSIAAIAGTAAAKAAKLQILAPNIEDFAQFETRFAVIAPIQLAMQQIDKSFPGNPILSCSVELDPEQTDYTSFFTATIARLGATVLNTITVPVEERPWTFRYIIDLRVQNNSQAQELWAAIRERATRARILGLYESIRI